MKNDFLEKQLKHKERNIQDLVRFIKTKAGKTSNFALFLGSGCSISSGVKSAAQLSEEWLKEIYLNENIRNNDTADVDNFSSEIARKYLLEHCGEWYNPSHEYSCLFEKRFDLPSQRRAFVEEEVGGKFPSIGYAYLIRLIEEHYFNTIFTTNFDDLLNEAFHLFADNNFSDATQNRDLMRPILCAHDSSVKSISISSARPKIVKLHGDYLFDDIKSTLRETESLEDNIRNKFVEFCKEFGLIVVGYSGNDRSIMDVINYLLKSDDYLKNGLYWCIRQSDDISDELKKLLWKERVYYVYIDGFDELFAQLYHQIIAPDQLPIPRTLPNKSNVIVEKLANNEILKKSSSPFIQDILSKLRDEYRRNSFFNNMKDVLFPEGKIEDFQGLSTDETIELFEIDRLRQTKQEEQALKRISKCISEPTYSFELKNRLKRTCANIYGSLSKNDDAVKICNELIEENNHQVEAYFFKNKFLDSYEERIRTLRDCLEFNKFQSECYEKISHYEWKILSRTFDGSERTKLALELTDDIEKGLQCNPFLENKCYYTKFTYLLDQRKAAQEDWYSEAQRILDIASKQNPEHPICYDYQHQLIVHSTVDKLEKQSKFEELWHQLSAKVTQHFELYIGLCIDLLDENIVKQEKIDFVRKQIDNNKERLKNNYHFTRIFARFYAVRCGEITKAIELITSLSDDEYNLQDMYLLRTLGELKQDTSSIVPIIKRVKPQFKRRARLELDHILAEIDKDYGASLKILDELTQMEFYKYEFFTQRMYAYLCDEKYEKVYEESQKMLGEITAPDSRSTCDIINYEIARKQTNRTLRKEVLNSIISSTNNLAFKAASFLILGKTADANKIIEDDILFDYEALHTYERSFVFQRFGNDNTKRILQEKRKTIR